MSTSAIPVTMMLHQWELASLFCDELYEVLREQPLPIWEACADCYRDLIQARLTRSTAWVGDLKAHIHTLKATGFIVHLSLIECLYAERLSEKGDHQCALDVVEPAIADCLRRDEHWCMPELVRVRSDIALRDDFVNSRAQAERELRRALSMASEQGATLWELRVAKRLASLLAEAGEPSEARSILATVYDRFCEGGSSPDLTAASLMLESLASLDRSEGRTVTGQLD